jgi:hypothetical protein
MSTNTEGEIAECRQQRIARLGSGKKPAYVPLAIA